MICGACGRIALGAGTVGAADLGLGKMMIHLVPPNACQL